MNEGRSSKGDSQPGQRQTPKRKSGWDEDEEAEELTEEATRSLLLLLLLWPFLLLW